jgi:mono/diheme cytochrome c family protein
MSLLFVFFLLVIFLTLMDREKLSFIAFGVLLAIGLGQSMPIHAASPEGPKRGEYMTRAGDCISCHTAPGGKPYAGGLAMHTPFGTIYTPNITPDDETGIGTWTEHDFYRSMHEGVGKHGEYLYPVMPFTFYSKMTREDVDAVYRYLRSIEPVEKRNRSVDFRFPFNVRLSMLGWRELYFNPRTFQFDPERSEEWNRGAYLLEGPGHCGACHSPRNALGAIEKERIYTGATVEGWFALNLTEDLQSGLGAWSVDEVAEFLKTGASKSKGATAFGPMEEVVHNSLLYLTDNDIRAMAVYLKSLPARATDSAALSYAEPHRREGARLYLDNCAMCHQAKGAGIPGVFPKLADNGAVNASDPANLVNVTLAGIPGRGEYAAMPSFAEKLSDDQIAALLNYVRTSWGNSANPNVSPEMVRKRREHPL